jgi:hypothetical protein
MTNRRRWFFRLSLIVAIAFALPLVAGLWYRWPSFTRELVPPPQYPLPDTVEGWPYPLTPEWRMKLDQEYKEGRFEDRFLGHTERSIVERFGQPDFRLKGDRRDWRVDRRRAYFEAFTVQYVRPSGRLYLSFCRQAGEWVCYDAHWNPDGLIICDV